MYYFYKKIAKQIKKEESMDLMSVKKLLRVFLAFLLFVGWSDLPVLAETIKLKSGDVVEGTITRVDWNMIYFKEKNTNKIMKVRKRKVESIDGITMSEWRKSGKVDGKIPEGENITFSKETELNIKIGLDVSGETSYSGDFNDDIDVENETSFTGEYIGFLNQDVGIGIGLHSRCLVRKKVSMENSISYQYMD